MAIRGAWETLDEARGTRPCLGRAPQRYESTDGDHLALLAQRSAGEALLVLRRESQRSRGVRAERRLGALEQIDLRLAVAGGARGRRRPLPRPPRRPPRGGGGAGGG